MEEYKAAVSAFKQTPGFSYDADPGKIRIGYQYRGFESFWNIIESDSFWATDARYSNDTQEQRFAADIFAYKAKTPVTLSEDYIVCFCAKDDKLSQWRGYAAQGGVSIGFDFDGAVPFHVPLARKTLDPVMNKEDYRKVFVQYGRVLYVDPRQGEENDADYYAACYDAISNHAVPKDWVGCAPDTFWEELKKSAPFIKHSGFQEEEEWRLVFRNEDQSLSPCVRYHDPDRFGIRRPYIVVRPGDPMANTKSCVVRLCVDDRIMPKLLTRLRKELGTIMVDSCQMNAEQRDKEDHFCFGCTRRRWMGKHNTIPCRYQMDPKAEFRLGVHKKENSIIISQGQNQEAVFEKVHTCVEKYLKDEEPDEVMAKKIPVWCEGHLPIRSLTVGPCIHQREMMDAIQHYCNHVYWLRDVAIAASRIPFRRST